MSETRDFGTEPWESDDWLNPSQTSGSNPQSQHTHSKPSALIPFWASRFKAFYGADLNRNPNFRNAIDGRKLNDNALYFQVSPYAFARRSMMRTATVRNLLLERKLPRIINKNDQIMVIVSMEWLFGSTSLNELEHLGFNPEDFLDVGW